MFLVKSDQRLSLIHIISNIHQANCAVLSVQKISAKISSPKSSIRTVVLRQMNTNDAGAKNKQAHPPRHMCNAHHPGPPKKGVVYSKDDYISIIRRPSEQRSEGVRGKPELAVETSR